MQNQFYVFLLCLAVGFLMGIVYEICAFLRLIFRCENKNKGLGTLFDVLFFLSFGIAAVFTAYVFHFPSFRVYMCLGYALGLIIYLKSLHRILAFFQRICYNKINKWIKRRKIRRKVRKTV